MKSLPSRLFSGFALVLVLLTGAPMVMAQAEPARKAVLVTGASTGIGRKITEAFAAKGYFVYAGARKKKDMDALNALDNVMAVRLDVTIQDEIDAAVRTIEAEGRGLWGLINNAGVAIGGPLLDVDVEEYEYLMDVNVTGVYRVTQAFAPLIMASGGRIATTGSIAGINTGPFGGIYSMSKHAVEAYTDALAAEMAMVGVKVSVIEPGNYDSRIAATAIKRMRAHKEAYLKEGSPFAKGVQEYLDGDGDRSMYKPPDEVAKAALHAMFAEDPLRRYMVVPEESNAAWAIDKQIEELVQLNAWNAYRYSREELIAKLDAVSAAEDDEAQIRALLADFLKNSGTAAAHQRMWGDDLVYTSSDGSRTNKAEILAGFDTGTEKETLSTVDYRGEDVDVRLYGATAVVTFRLVGTPKDGSAERHYFNTGTFAKRDGQWVAVAWQATKLPG